MISMRQDLLAERVGKYLKNHLYTQDIDFFTVPYSDHFILDYEEAFDRLEVDAELKPHEALLPFRQIYDAAPHHLSALLRAEAARKTPEANAHAEAIFYFGEWDQSYPWDSGVILNTTLIYADQGKYVEASRYLAGKTDLVDVLQSRATSQDRIRLELLASLAKRIAPAISEKEQSASQLMAFTRMRF